MDNLFVSGPCPMKGEIYVSGAKNVAMKVLLAGLLTDQPLFIRNVPLISSVYGTAEIVSSLGVKVLFSDDHSMEIRGNGRGDVSVPLETGSLFRTATMVLGPLLVRHGKAVVPNPGGCRVGKRPIDRHIEGLRAMGAKISYSDGFFYASCDRLRGVSYRFEKNTHTGTETMILAAVLADGETVLDNAAEEPEVDDFIRFLVLMGAKIKRTQRRRIVIQGVSTLHGAEFSVMPDRNEVVTFAVGAVASGGDIVVHGTERAHLAAFFSALDLAGAKWEPVSSLSTRFSAMRPLRATSLTTACFPGFMTDWQSPWALLMTQARGVSTIHETIYEDRFGYASELSKMGASLQLYSPVVSDPDAVYDFHWSEKQKNLFHGMRVRGVTPLHNAVLEVSDLRAGATLVLAAAISEGTSIIRGIEHIDRGYENIEGRLKDLGVKIYRKKEEV